MDEGWRECADGTGQRTEEREDNLPSHHRSLLYPLFIIVNLAESSHFIINSADNSLSFTTFTHPSTFMSSKHWSDPTPNSFTLLFLFCSHSLVSRTRSPIKYKPAPKCNIPQGHHVIKKNQPLSNSALGMSGVRVAPLHSHSLYPLSPADLSLSSYCYK